MSRLEKSSEASRRCKPVAASKSRIAMGLSVVPCELGTLGERAAEIGRAIANALNMVNKDECMMFDVMNVRGLKE